MNSSVKHEIFRGFITKYKYNRNNKDTIQWMRYIHAYRSQNELIKSQ